MADKHEWVKEKDGQVLLKMRLLSSGQWPQGVQRFEGYSILLTTGGKGKVWTGHQETSLTSDSVTCFSPFEPFRIMGNAAMKGYLLVFHPDFLCVYKHHAEIACNGILFDPIYQPANFRLDRSQAADLIRLLKQMQTEIRNGALANHEVLVSYLKVFLILATRARMTNGEGFAKEFSKPVFVRQFRESLERNFRKQHAIAFYANQLQLSAKRLSQLSKEHMGKAPTEVIADRLMLEAKRELYLTSHPIKRIGRELGFQDEFYFSRFFKKNAGVSPAAYRDRIGFAKAEMA